MAEQKKQNNTKPKAKPTGQGQRNNRPSYKAKDKTKTTTQGKTNLHLGAKITEEQASKNTLNAVKDLANVDNKNFDNTGDDFIDYHLTSKYAIDAEEKEEQQATSFSKKARIGKKPQRTQATPVKTKGGKPVKNKNAIQQAFVKPTQPQVHEIVIGELISVPDLANQLSIKAANLLKELFKLGISITINQTLDQETAVLIVEELGHKAILKNSNALEDEVAELSKNTNNLQPRAPIVTIMGHVDHGKTSLLDFILHTKMTAKEFGGITQHIGAYHIKSSRGYISFIDTPGHAAFTAMRARGAQVTDIVVLIVAADDGVMPQTVEAIQHAQAAQVPMIVAINKIDKIGADPQKVKSELAQNGVAVEGWGGDIQVVEISAKTGQGVDDLLDAIVLQAEMLELKAAADGPANGTVLESYLDKNLGAVATVLVRNGQLNKGDVILCGNEYGKIRLMRNELGKTIKQAGPSLPVEILGLSGIVQAGDEFIVLDDEKKAREISTSRQNKNRDLKLAHQQRAKLENMFVNMTDEAVSLNLVIKADVQGSLEAIVSSLHDLNSDKAKINVIGSGVGGISESDVVLASASNAILIGFNVRANNLVRKIIENEGIDLRYYSVVYDLLNEIKAALQGLLAPDVKQKIIGLAEVRDIFRSPKLGAVAGCMVTEGTIKRSNPIRVLRDDIVIYEGELESLRRFKDNVSEVQHGLECGIGVKNYNDIKIGDQIEVYENVVTQ